MSEGVMSPSREAEEDYTSLKFACDSGSSLRRGLGCWSRDNLQPKLTSPLARPLSAQSTLIKRTAEGSTRHGAESTARRPQSAALPSEHARSRHSVPGRLTNAGIFDPWAVFEHNAISRKLPQASTRQVYAHVATIYQGATAAYNSDAMSTTSRKDWQASMHNQTRRPVSGFAGGYPRRARVPSATSTRSSASGALMFDDVHSRIRPISALTYVTPVSHADEHALYPVARAIRDEAETAERAAAVASVVDEWYDPPGSVSASRRRARVRSRPLTAASSATRVPADGTASVRTAVDRIARNPEEERSRVEAWVAEHSQDNASGAPLPLAAERTAEWSEADTFGGNIAWIDVSEDINAGARAPVRPPPPARSTASASASRTHTGLIAPGRSPARVMSAPAARQRSGILRQSSASSARAASGNGGATDASAAATARPSSARPPSGSSHAARSGRPPSGSKRGAVMFKAANDEYYDAIPEDESMHEDDTELAAAAAPSQARSIEPSTLPAAKCMHTINAARPYSPPPQGSVRAHEPRPPQPNLLCNPERHVLKLRPAQMMDRRYSLAEAKAPKPVYEPISDTPVDYTGPLETSAHVVDYFLKVGPAAQKQLFYLNARRPRDLLDTVSPFDLVVVRREERDRHSFTMTLNGVSEFHGDQEADFTPIGTWIKLSSTTDLVVELPFFKFYRVWKAFKTWHRARQRTHLRRRQVWLSKKLAFVKESQQQVFASITGACAKIQSTRFCKLATHFDRLYLIEDFVSDQDSQRNNVAQPGIADATADVIKTLRDLRHKVEQHAAKMTVMVEQELHDPSPITLPPPGRMKGFTMLEMRLNKRERISMYHDSIAERDRLPRKVRLADYMVVEAVIDATLSSMEEIAAILHDESKARGVFQTQVFFAPGQGYQYSPPEHFVDSAIRGALNGMCEAADKTGRPYLHRELAYDSFGILNVATSKLDLREVIQSSERYRAAHDAIFSKLEASWAAAAAYVQRFQTDRPMFDWLQAWDKDAMGARLRGFELSSSSRLYRKELARVRDGLQAVDRMKLSQKCGALFVQTKETKAKMSEGLQAARQEMLDLLQAYNVEVAATVTAEVRVAIESVSFSPDDLFSFAEFKRQIAAGTKARPALSRRCTAVEDLFLLMAEYGRKPDFKMTASLDTMQEVINKLKALLTEGEAWVAQHQSEQVEELASRVDALNTHLREMSIAVLKGPLTQPDNTSEAMLIVIRDLEASIHAAAEQSAELTDTAQLFGVEHDVVVTGLSDLQSEFEKKRNTWETMYAFETASAKWRYGDVREVDLQEVQTMVDTVGRDAFKASKSQKGDLVIIKLKDLVDQFRQFLPLLEEVCNPALEVRHWKDIYALIDETYTSDAKVSVATLIERGIAEKLEPLSNISGAASKEASLRATLDGMLAQWADLAFALAPYKDSGTFILGGVDEIQLLLDDHLMKVQAMAASPFVQPFRERAELWQRTMNNLQDILDNWIQCQSTWMYLEPIFTSEDIIKQMPAEGEKFGRVDGRFRAIMSDAFNNPAVVPIAQSEETLETLVEANKLLDDIQKGLAAYLEKKRLFFPRFFFLSNDEMLEILSETKDPTRVQPHLSKCFEGVSTLVFNARLVITDMNSVEGERVPFVTPVDTKAARGKVEAWLLEVEAGMFKSVHAVVRRGMEAYTAAPRAEWVLQWPGMVVLLVTLLYWTRETEDALARRGLPGALEASSAALMDVVNLVRGDITKLQRTTLGALVVMDVHARDVLADMLQHKVPDASDFGWQAQLRGYWVAETDAAGHATERGFTAQMKIMSAVLEYGYEYLGNSSRLVITPLTDRCYRTLMGAIHMTLGGAPEGPAGTGKTETTKDLAKAMARQCVVFNCSDSLDYVAMGKFFKGLASSGAWACFDEFNRIDLEVLSVVAQQVLDIQRAIAAKKHSFVFEGTEMELKWTAWCSITMNPGYAGRSELPDNLKALFRTVAMMVPDYAMISEIILFSYGYMQARDCARKIVQCYKLCSELLSSQDHYDYGMRAVMAVLRAAGNLKRRMPSMDESVLMLRSIIDVNECKFLTHDVKLFKGIVSDLFPSVELPEPDYALMDAAMADACAEQGLQLTPYFRLKVIQLYEMIVVRHGLMLVGSPFSGKTCSYRVLARALVLMHEREQEEQQPATPYVINPKSVTMGQLYGQFDPVSHEWSDGVLAVTFRKCASEQTPSRKWLVLDGPVDAIWIENMNTVLDDNKKLCLNSGEIITMSASMNMIFEVADLAVASPATVSRCGMVYLEPASLGWEPLVDSWIQTTPAALGDSSRKHLRALFDWLVPVGLRWVGREVKQVSPVAPGTMVTALTRLFSALFGDALDDAAVRKLKPAGVAAHLEQTFVFSYVWSLGATSSDASTWPAFDAFLRAAVTGTLALYISPSGERYDGPGDVPDAPPTLTGWSLPADLSVYDIVRCPEDAEALDGVWTAWDRLIPDTLIPPDAAFSEIIVVTPDAMRIEFMLRHAVKGRYPLLLVGDTGTGKTTYAMRFFAALDADRFVPPICVTFSARTTANQAQYLIDAKLDKRKKGIYGPTLGKVALVLVDDLNMPHVEVYGAQPPIELLRQYMDHGGWYDRDNTFRTMQDVLFLAAMGLPGGGRTHVTQRYLRHFHTLVTPAVPRASLEHIFGTLHNWFLTCRAFSKPVIDAAGGVIRTVLEVYATAVDVLLPTPLKSHYVFNLRDVARVVAGLHAARPDAFGHGPGSEVAQHVRLLVHELLRVFYDRLVDDADRMWLVAVLRERIAANFKGVTLESLLEHITNGPPAGVQLQHVRQLFFGDFLSEPNADGVRPYREITDIDGLREKLEEFLADYNAVNVKAQMPLAVFLYAMEHVSRIARVLNQPAGHVLNVGVGGSGRASLSTLAAFICDLEVHTVEISRAYGVQDWHEDLKRFTRRAGALNKPGILLFSDTQVKDEAFVEDINNLLNAGEVPNLFPYDERAALMEDCRAASKKLGLKLDTPQQLWTFFLERTKANLHVVLCFSPIGGAFRERLRQFPSLVNCCTINWFTEWPSDALEAVAAKYLSSLHASGQVKEQVTSLCKSFHQDAQRLTERFRKETGRYNYVTPTSYIELLGSFVLLLQRQRGDVHAAKERYIVGLQKLQSTSEQVTVMQEDLKALQPNLVKTVAEVEALVEAVQREKTTVVEPQKAIVDAEVQEADKTAQHAKGIKDECEGILSEAMPALNAAIAALNTIKPADIKLVQSFKSPPGAVKVVLEAVCVMMDVKPAMVNDPNTPGKKIVDYWGPSKTMLNDPQFVAKLKEFDRDNIDEKIIEKVRKTYTSNPDFTPANAAKASSAAEGLCKWVHAMDSYEKVAKVVGPKRIALAEAESTYNHVMTGLRAKQAQLEELMAKLAGMEQQLQESTEKKDRLEKEIEVCKQKLVRAEKLIGGLGGEKARWTGAAEHLQHVYDRIMGDALLCAAVISYLGVFTMSYRDATVTSWLAQCKAAGVPGRETFSLVESLGDPVKIRSWTLSGLPSDSFSIDNGIIMQNSRRWPLLLDPQGQANRWLRKLHAEKLVVCKLSDADFLRRLENAIRFGQPVLLENVGEVLEASLESLLKRQTFKSSGVECIKLGDNIVEWSADFALFITTTLRNPHYLPETAVKVTLLNFMITQQGLADQLLGVAVAEDMPVLDGQRQSLVVESAEHKRRLKEIEEQILHTLSASEGNILDDASAVEILSEAKLVSDDIQKKEIVAEQTQKRVDAARRGYTPTGAFNAVLFFCVVDMAAQDPMYHFSLSWFVGLFVRSLQASRREELSGSAPPKDIEGRLKDIADHFIYALYCNVCTGLFERDKLLFSMLVACRVSAHEGTLDSDALTIFLNPAARSGTGAPVKRPDAAWLSEPVWESLLAVRSLGDALRSAVDSIAQQPDAWEPLASMVDVAAATLPFDLDTTLTPFERLLLLKTLRPDDAVPAVAAYVAATLGVKFTEPPLFDLEACYAESSATVPLLFILSPGTDPTASLLKFADDRGFASKISVISMGQGQGPKAAALLEDALAAGLWVLLQNCHLAASWMPTLERIYEGITAETADKEFRLWMTSMPSPAFPVSVLQNCVKMTNEPPTGVKANMRRSFTLFPLNDAPFFEGSRAFKKLLFGLVFVHAFVQERRNYGPIGWNIPYSFDDGDLRISARQLRMYVDDTAPGAPVPFAALKYAIGECNYGGRVTDDKDRRLLSTLLDCVFRREALQVEPFALSEGGSYAIPTGDFSLTDARETIEALPAGQRPEVFALHDNARITSMLRQTDVMVAGLIRVGAGASGPGGSSGESVEVVAGRLAAEVLAKLPPPFDLEKASQKYPVLYEQSLNQVLIQEMMRYNGLLQVIVQSAKNVEKAAAGLQVMSAQVEAVARSMALGQVPALWKCSSYPSLKPLGSYIGDLLARLHMLQNWYENGAPSVFWLSGFFFTPSFCTAVLQNHARRHKLAIDAITLDFHVQRGSPADIQSGPESGVYVYGLLLEGAGWSDEEQTLCESQPRVLYQEAPILWLRPCSADDIELKQHYNCPVYRTAERRGVLATTGHNSNFLMYVRMPSRVPQHHWVLRGVCMLCALST